MFESERGDEVDAILEVLLKPSWQHSFFPPGEAMATLPSAVAWRPGVAQRLERSGNAGRQLAAQRIPSSDKASRGAAGCVLQPGIPG